MPGYGQHEVIIETPEHNRDILNVNGRSWHDYRDLLPAL